jgi:hypothetical protein
VTPNKHLRRLQILAEFRHELCMFLQFSEAAATQRNLPALQHQLLLQISEAPDGVPPHRCLRVLLPLRPSGYAPAEPSTPNLNVPQGRPKQTAAAGQAQIAEVSRDFPQKRKGETYERRTRKAVSERFHGRNDVD